MDHADIDLANLDTKPFFETQVKIAIDILNSVYPETSIYLYTLGESDDFVLKDLPTNGHQVSKTISSATQALTETLSQNEFTSIFIKNQENREIFSIQPEEQSEYSLLTPISKLGNMVGFLFTILPHGRGPSDYNQSVFNNLALSVGSSYILSDSLEKLKSRSNHLSLMLEVNTHLNIAATKTDYLFEISRFGKYFIHFDRAVLVLHPEETPEYFSVDSIEGDETGLQLGMSYPVYKSLVSRSIITGQFFIFKQSHAEQPEGIYHEGDIEEYPYKQVIGFPLSKTRNGSGVLVLESLDEYDIKQSQISIFEMISQSLGAALTRFSLYERLNNYATIDTLTQLYNLRALKQRFEEELARAGRYQNSLVVLFLDLDKFKLVNDTYGHLMGDYVLRETSQIIRDTVRTSDIPGRYGGEEFVVIMVNSDAKACMASARRICSAIHERKFTMNDVTVDSRVSIGLAEYPHDGETMQELIQSADAAMYTAKKHGGDQVVKYEKGMVPKSQA